MPLALTVDRRQLDTLCRRRGIRRLRVFGSALRPDFRPESDVDVLVDFQPGRTPGLAFVAIAEELSGVFGRQVDLHTPASLSPYIRERVLQEAEPLYDEA